jgi:hypothetical protein
MRKVLIGLTLVAAAAATTPALAQSNSGMWNNNQQVWTYSTDYRQSYAYAPQDFFGIVSRPGIYGDRAQSVQYGKYIGQDPDPNVRLELQRGSVVFE